MNEFWQYTEQFYTVSKEKHISPQEKNPEYPGSGNCFDCVRNAPIYYPDRDLLIETASFLEKTLHLPHISCFQPVFPDFGKADEALSHISGCSACLTQLIYEKDLNNHQAWELGLIEASAQIYHREMQRQLGGLFRTNHPFWAQFYKRLHASGHYDRDEGTRKYFSDPDLAKSAYHFKQRFGLILVPLDALHDLHGRKNQLEYELIAQSIMEVYYASFTAKNDAGDLAREHFRKAISLTKHLGIEPYQAWISRLMEKFNASHTPQ